MATKKRLSNQREMPAAIAGSRIERYYNKIVTLFILCTILLVALIVYFSFTKTEIVLHPNAQETSVEIETTLQELNGLVLLADIEEKSTSTEIKGSQQTPGKASGTVIIENHYTTAQPLVENTRLLSTEGVLFRTTETVTVPAGGSVSVGVVADQEGAEGNIPASRFEVVALWDGLKDKIFATSSTAMTGGVVSVGVLSDTDIANAFDTLKMSAAEKAYDAIEKSKNERRDIDPTLVLLKQSIPLLVSEANVSSSAVAGDQTSALEVQGTYTYALPLIAEEQLLTIINNQINEQLTDGMVLAQTTINPNDVFVTLTALSEDKTNGDITLSFTAQTTISSNSNFIDREELTNKTEQEVKTYFSTFPTINNAEVRFSPFWLRRTPAVAGNITITVE